MQLVWPQGSNFYRKQLSSAQRASSDEYSGTSIIRTSIIRISRLPGLFLWSEFGHEYLLVTTKIRGHILLKLQHWKVQSSAKVFCCQRANATLARFVNFEERSNEFWFAQSCVVANWNFTLYGLLGVVWKRHNNVDTTQIMQLWRMMELSMRTRGCNQFCWVLLFINIHIFDYLFRVVPTSPDNRGSTVLEAWGYET